MGTGAILEVAPQFMDGVLKDFEGTVSEANQVLDLTNDNHLKKGE